MIDVVGEVRAIDGQASHIVDRQAINVAGIELDFRQRKWRAGEINAPGEQ
jgi:hypothetical protein